MWYIAFSIGLFGSLHCVGMCGPLAVAFCNRKDATQFQALSSSISYNLGRTVSYTLLGLMFGILGSILFLADLQKISSILLGGLLILSFLLKIDIDNKLNSNKWVKDYYSTLRSFISGIMQKSQSYHPFQLGMANGFLPCGLVYLALAGALASGNVLSGMSFMMFFGLGTMPLLFILTSGIQIIPMQMRLRFRTILPYVTLAFGIFLIYRGLSVEMPQQIHFWEAVKNPVLCH